MNWQGMYYFLNLIFQKNLKFEEDVADGGKRGEYAYLRHISYQGAAERYEEITDEIRERIDFELKTIENSGYPGYFLIVEDFIREASEYGCFRRSRAWFRSRFGGGLLPKDHQYRPA